MINFSNNNQSHINMIRFSEYVSLGHPDKIADYISQYILDRYIERDPNTRYAVEVQIKDRHVTIGGEITSAVGFSSSMIARFAREAVNEIGYTQEYQRKWGKENTICGDELEVDVFINDQSPDIAQGVDNNSGWGDQGIFFGMCEYNPQTCGMPYDHTIAKRLCHALFESKLGGLDIKTQVVTDNDKIKKVIVAVPLLATTRPDIVLDFIKAHIPARRGTYEIVLNGTGRYVRHSSLADCGTTGRKLAVDFYGGNCRIGGGSPWTKDGTKADLTLNLVARRLAKNYAIEHGCTVFVSLACAIGSDSVDMCVTDNAGNIIVSGVTTLNPHTLRHDYKLDTPIYASMCRWGLFGEFQQDKVWE